LKVGLNATCFNDRPSGARKRFVGIYGELVKRLPDTEFIIFEPVGSKVTAWFHELPNILARPTPIPNQGRLRKFSAGIRYWPNELTLDSFDLFECFNMPLVKSPSGKTLLTVHDIRGMHSEKGVLDRAIFKEVLGRSFKTANHLITVSETMKKEILGFFPNISISVIYNGLDAREFEQISESDLRAFQKKYRLPESFALTVGHFEKRKNYLRLIDAMALLRDRGITCPLLIIGNDSGERKAVEAHMASVNIRDSVKLLSGLTDHEVLCAYKLCCLFVFPSSYEGFGIPILEAMAAGKPMVLSDLSVFREIIDPELHFSDQL